MTISWVRALGAAILLAVSFGASATAMPRFDKLEQTLKIRPEQKEQFDVAVGATQRALLSVALTAMQLKERLAQELSKPWPDLGALAEAHEAIIEQNRPIFKAAGEEWKKLYALLDDEQVEIAKSFLRENLSSLFR
jgi:CelD/BcsL family acetyltransferase involved in cellulose biosynthesis